MSCIQSLLVKTYVNCVKFLNETYLFASAGNTLQVYNVITSQLLNSVTIFRCQRIHGIVVKDAQVIIYGGFDLALVKITMENEKPAINIISKWTTENWVQDASFFEGNSYVVLGSSNVLYLYTLGDKIQLDRIAHCKEKSFFQYTTQACSQSNGICIWPLCEDNSTQLKQIDINFSTDDFPRQVVIARNNKLLVYTNNGTILTYKGDKCEKVLEDSRFKSYCILTISRNKQYYSAASIGGDILIFNEENDRVSCEYNAGKEKIFSFHWLDKSRFVICTSQGKLSLLDFDLENNCILETSKFVLPMCKERWLTSAVLADDLFICGDRDGSVHVYNLGTQCLLKTYHKIHSRLGVSCIEYNERDKTLMSIGRDGFLRYWEIAKGITKDDALTSIRFSDVNTEVDNFHDSNLNNNTACDRTLLHVSAHSIGGDMLIFNEENNHVLCEYNAGNEKIFSFHWLDESRFVICTSQGKLSLLHFDHENNCILETSKFVLPMCKERWLTSAVLADDLFICGDRDGSVHVYNLGTQCLLKTYHKIHSRLGVSCIEYNERDKTLMSIGRDGFLRYWEIAKGITKDDALTSARFSEVNTEVDNFHDSNLNNNTACDRTLLHVSADKLPLEWPVYIIPSIGDTLIIGFNEVNLVIWSTQEQKIILKLKCGGGHRSWDYCLEGSQFYFSFIKQKQVYHMDLDLSTLTRPALVQSFHRDEINTLRCVHMKNNLLISGGEDNTLRISVVSQTPLGLELQTRLILRSHISSIRCLNYVSLGRDVYIVSGGGRAQLKIWKVTCSGTEDSKVFAQNVSNIEKEPGQIGNDKSDLEKEEINYGNNNNENKSIRSVEEYVDYGEKAPETECNKNFVQSNSIQSIPVQYQCKELLSHMLNGEDRKEKSWKHVTPRINPETRYMDIALHHAQSNLYIATACSDGYVRIFLYHIGNNVFSCIQELNYHRKCVLKVHLVEYDSRILLCSLSSNGDLAIWDFSSLINSASTTSGLPVNLNRTENSCRDITSLNNSRSRSTQKQSTTQTDEKSDLLRAESSKPSLGNTESTFLLPTPLLSSLSQDRLILSQEEPPNLATPLPLLTIHLHRGGVNSFDSRPVGTDLILVSGGDDCSLNLTVLTRELNQRYQRRQRRAHNSQITGVKFLDDERFVSTSVDQQIIVWTWEGEKGLSQEEISAQQKRNLSQEKISNQQKKLSQENGILSEEISSQHTRSSNQNEKLSQGILSQEKGNLSQEKCDLNHEKGNLSLHKNSSQTEGVLSQELVKLSQHETK
ncbi:LOW QUALITY PROTEIN: uncharacterized protein LOC113467469, partial [Diaphorina citri]|uniref:tRNA (34-2'-O)-methyltransferase regulator WDR6 n=1 Tax=Diaphorina citri TaxID=121845 RepID=A0A3Q0IT71_DIACI